MPNIYKNEVILDPNTLNITVDPVEVTLDPSTLNITNEVVLDPNTLNITVDPVEVSFPQEQITVNSPLPSFLIDLFGRLRVSEPIIQLQVTQSDPSISYFVTEGEVSGSGTSSVYSQLQACTDLSVGSQDGLRRFRTRVPGMYQAGKSLILLFTYNFLTSGNLAWVLRTSTSGSIVETAVAQADWNVDKFDGLGPSGINLDQTKSHIGFIGIEWLGVGDVVCGFIHNRLPSVAHVFKHSNALTGVYMRSGNLFPCYEIQKQSSVVTKRIGYYDPSDGVFLRQQNGGSSVRVICSSLINEGVVDQTGIQYSIALDLTYTFNTKAENTIKPLILFRLKPSAITSRVIPVSAEVSVSTNSDFYVYLMRNPTFSDTLTPSFTPLPNKSLEFDNQVSQTVHITNPLESVVWQGIGNKNSDFVSGSFNSFDILGSFYDGTPELWCLGIACSVANQSVKFALVRFMEMI